MLNREHKEFLKTEQGRKWFIKKSLEVTPKDKNWQAFYTPYDFCEYMISKTDVTDKNILVLFNIEFLEILIHKFGVLNKDITFVADCRLESEIADKIYGVENIIVNNIKDIQEALKTMKTFDLCFSNPPYTSLIDLEILNTIYKIVDEMVVVHPANWLIERKSVYQLFIDSKTNFANTLKSATLFNGNYVFNIRQYPPCVISHIDKNKNINTPIDVNWFGERFQVFDIDNITVHNSSWEDIVLPFKNKMENYIKDSKLGSLSDHIIDINNIDKRKFHFQLAATRGSVTNTKSKTATWHTPMWDKDFYTLCRVDTDSIKNTIGSNSTLLFEFDTIIELDNFIEYIKSKFARFCLSILKAGQGNSIFEIGLIPWLGFKERLDDQTLYADFEISIETQAYIENFISDYYNIRSES